jgi:hypothetical protein
MALRKVEAARRQLGSALALYLQDHDPVSVHCLAGGGCELIEYYAQKAGGEPFSSHALATFPDLDVRELRRLQRQYWNAFKHATHPHGGGEREDDDPLAAFTDEQNDHALFIGWYDYGMVEALPMEAQVHQIWYFALHPEKLNPDQELPLEMLFPDLRSRPRGEQKRMLNVQIGKAKSVADFMNDPKTDRRPLIIDWP